jgi:hypothetical protein
MKLTHLLLLTTLAGSFGVASAQWQWIDKDGHKVFSDRAPPTDIPDKSILKRPGSRAPVVPLSDAVADSEAPAGATSAPVPVKSAGGLDKELEAKKKKAQEAEAAKRKAAEAEMAKARAENCARARAAKASLESGDRIGYTNAAGVRGTMDEATRAMEIKRAIGIMERDCK